MKINLLLVTILIQICSSLHISHLSQYDYKAENYDYFVSDDLDGSNLNYYFANLPPSNYYNWIAVNSKNSNPAKCNTTGPFAKYQTGSNKFLGCIACEPLSTNVNVKTAKVLYNVETRECEVCTPEKTAICNTLLNISSVQPPKSIFSPLNQTNTQSYGIISSSLQDPSQKISPFELCSPQRPLYNPDTKLCDDCPKLQQFDGATQSCLPIIFTTYLLAQNILLPNAGAVDEQQYLIQQAHPTRLAHECPPSTPYLQNNSCVSCQSKWLFNFSSQNCLEKCSEGTFYNPQTFSCSKGVYYSDVTAPNIVSQTQSYDSWKASIDSQSRVSAKMVKCTLQTPFSVNGRCISCDGNSPLFNIDKKECGSCSPGRSYNPQKRRCIGSYDGSSSLRRMIANVG